MGGFHFPTLARLGIGQFTLAEFDHFDLVNFNRQAGATMNTLGRSKLEVMVEQALAINPEADIRCFTKGLDAGNVSDFLDGADLYVDGLDFFALEAREDVFGACARLGIPATTVAPLGMGAALLNFLPANRRLRSILASPDETRRSRRCVFSSDWRPHGCRWPIWPTRP